MKSAAVIALYLIAISIAAGVAVSWDSNNIARARNERSAFVIDSLTREIGYTWGVVDMKENQIGLIIAEAKALAKKHRCARAFKDLGK